MDDCLLLDEKRLFKKSAVEVAFCSSGPCYHLERFEYFPEPLNASVLIELIYDLSYLSHKADDFAPLAKTLS